MSAPTSDSHDFVRVKINKSQKKISSPLLTPEMPSLCRGYTVQHVGMKEERMGSYCSEKREDFRGRLGAAYNKEDAYKRRKS